MRPWILCCGLSKNRAPACWLPSCCSRLTPFMCGMAPSLPESYIKAIDGEAIGPCAGSCGTAAYRREPVIVEDIATDPLWATYKSFALEHGLRACWSTPIFDEQHCVLGTFALCFRQSGRPGNRHLKQIEMGTHTASIAIVKHRERQALGSAEQRLRLALEAGTIGIWEIGIGSDRLTWSSQLKAIFGYPNCFVARSSSE